jgi:hypothetical protein
MRKVSQLRTASVMASAVLLILSFGPSPAAATVYSPPWADGMWAHFPGSGGLDTTNTINLMKAGANSLGYHGFSTNPSTMPSSMGAGYAQSDAIWWMAGHGGAGVIQSYNPTNGWGSLYVSSNSPFYSSCSAPNDCLTDYSSTSMHRIRLMVFQACDSADATPNGDRLPKRAVINLGVDSSLGFTELIGAAAWPDRWSEFFFDYADTKNVVDSAAAAAGVIYAGAGDAYGYDSYYVFGGNVMIDPPAYGGKYLLAGAGGATILLASTFALRSTGAVDTLDPAKTVQISSTDAASRLASFADVSSDGLSVSDPVDGPITRLYVVDGRSISGTVDAHDGHVITLLYAGIAGGSDVSTKADDAVANARAFLDEHGIAFEGLNESVELVDHGDTNEYVVKWERVVDGVIVPDSRLVGVDAATGRIFRYANVSRAYQAPGKPTIDQSSAIELAVEASGLGAAAAVERTELRIAFDAFGKQYLAWRVVLTGPVEGAPAGGPMAHAFVEVNANSGEATILGRG